MPTDTKIKVVLGFTDGTKITRIENLEDVTGFLEQHDEFVKVVRCKDCKRSEYDELFHERWCNGNRVEDYDFCSYGERKDDETD